MKRIRWWVCIMVLVFDGSIYVTRSEKTYHLAQKNVLLL